MTGVGVLRLHSELPVEKAGVRWSCVKGANSQVGLSRQLPCAKSGPTHPSDNRDVRLQTFTDFERCWLYFYRRQE